MRTFLNIILFSFFIISCSNPDRDLSKMTSLFLKDNRIEIEEWQELKSHIINHKDDFGDFYRQNDEFDDTKLESFISEIALKKHLKEIPVIEKSKTVQEVEPKISVYIENSGSMDGYVRGLTEFENAISDLLVELKYEYLQENLFVNFINTKIYKSEVNDINEFVESLDPDKAPYKVEKRSTSKLNEILKTIVDSTDNNTISLFASDCIYSLGSYENTLDKLAFQKSLTKDIFLQKSRELNISTLILKMKSKFDGYYYDLNNTPTYLSNKERPYYLWIIGENELINNFQQKIKFRNLKGFEDFYYLSNNSNENLFYTILQKTNKIGRFKKADRKSELIKSIEDCDTKDGEFQMALALDLRSFNLPNDYKTKISNYKISKGYDVTKIEELSQKNIDKNDFTKISKSPATHIITITKNKEAPFSDIQLSMINNLPNWVKNTSIIDDKNILNSLDKTFGIEYLIDGVYESYLKTNDEHNNYFTINIKIN